MAVVLAWLHSLVRKIFTPLFIYQNLILHTNTLVYCIFHFQVIVRSFGGIATLYKLQVINISSTRWVYTYKYICIYVCVLAIEAELLSCSFVKVVVAPFWFSAQLIELYRKFRNLSGSVLHIHIRHTDQTVTAFCESTLFDIEQLFIVFSGYSTISQIK